MERIRKNFTGIVDPDVNGQTSFDGYNFSQPAAHTRIFPNAAPETIYRFRQCNLSNCDLPQSSIKVECLHGHVTRDVANDDIIDIDGEQLLIPAFGWEKGT